MIKIDEEVWENIKVQLVTDYCPSTLGLDGSCNNHDNCVECWRQALRGVVVNE